MRHLSPKLKLFLKILLLSAVILISLTAIFGGFNKPKATVYERPTLLLTGYGANPDAFDDLVQHAEEHGHTQAVVTATIGSKSIKYTGNWHKGDHHPLVKVAFANNKLSWKDNAILLNHLLSDMKRKYDLKSFNAIAHSRGNLDLLIAYGEKHPLKLKRAVLVGTAANGHIGQDDKVGQNYFLKNGQPRYKHQAYYDLTKNKQHFPKGTHVLNIYGNVGNGSDTHVTNISSRSVKPALGSRFASYHEKMVRGRYATHHWIIRKNVQVRKLALNFIWPNAS